LAISRERKIAVLGEVCSVIKRGITPKYTDSSGVLVVNQRCIRDQSLSFDNARRNDLNKKNIPEDRYLQAGDVLINSTGVGTLGRVAQVSYLVDPATVDSHVTILRLSSDKIDRSYFGWVARSLEPTFESMGEGSTGQTELSRLRVAEVPISFPESREDQKSIAHILGTLDDKIELNRRMNETLEGMAQALFKSWFVDFDPVIDKALAAGNPIPEPLQKRAAARKQLGNKRKPLPAHIAKHFPDTFVFDEEMGWIPEGWELKKLSDLIEVKYGKDHKKLDVGHFPVYGSGGLMRHANNSLYSGESVLIPRKGTLSNILYVNEEFWTVDTMFYTIPRTDYIPKYAFYHLKRLDFSSMNVGSAVPSMTTKVLNELPIILPSLNVLREFDSALTSYFDIVAVSNGQTITLSNLRDTLLPKLLSGELRVPDAEKLIENSL
jgi:type I restriction enzyme, S subunit